MREVELGWGKVLLVKDNGEFHALGHKCPHYGAPLVKGEQGRLTWEMGYDHPCLWRDSCRPQDPNPFVESPGGGVGRFRRIQHPWSPKEQSLGMTLAWAFICLL